MKRKDKQIVKAYAKKLGITYEDVLFRIQIMFRYIEDATWEDTIKVLEKEI